MVRIAALAGLAALLAGPGSPVSAVAADEARYQLERVEGGFLRLDTITGRVSFCSERNADWTCESVPDERAAYEAEIDALEEDNLRLRAALEDEGAPIPSEDEIDQAMTVIEKVAKRFANVARILQDEVAELEDEIAQGGPAEGAGESEFSDGGTN